MNTIKDLGEDIHANAIKKGFWDDTVNVLSKMNDDISFSTDEEKAVMSAFRCQKLLLIVSEITEAMEADRIGKRANLAAFEARVEQVLTSMVKSSAEEKETEYAKLYKHHVKDSFEGEMAGATIRILDFCHQEGINLEKYIQLEHRYNKTRPVKHGKGY